VTKREEDELWLAERIELYWYAERVAYERYLSHNLGEKAARNLAERNLHAIVERDFNEPLPDDPT
jgi:hypothetical protein